ncbi:ATP-binding protein [Sinosporangium siamense]|uniref:ATP-binding protein n=1 Tax=Sinosporangium siamense TaxID=1367973 RepID=A0A919RC54_9ACTN|nr:ATP-binding protein [Sinosporangium siamense]GII90065.1 ATP-binding protein [Sinosporangium siamense]
MPATRHVRKNTLDWWPPAGWWPDPARDLLETASHASSATFVLPPKADSVHSSRNVTISTLTGWGMSAVAENMELVVSELSTNALRHGLNHDPGDGRAPRPHAGPQHRVPSSISLSLVRRGGFVTCALVDPGPGTPVLRFPDDDLEPGGLGLHIVDSLSVRWGWSPLTPYGKIVWAVLAA